MGSDSGCLEPNSCHLNGLMPNKTASLTRVLDMERWTRAEERTAELIARIQPDQSSWESRNAVASYVQRLITECIPCVVFVYGSVPLKTYLPDGDIDLTVFSEDQSFNDKCAAKVCSILEKAVTNEDAEYQIKEVQLIPAEVKVVKCLVDNIVVDISFSQLGGLYTLSFLEQVDQHINQNHLFKRSIILIKAWCYYESRLLGAYHGLLSTYALETLILYIFHVFNNSFAGPLEVLYRFLEFFSNFDWDNFCISLQGPVPIRSLPDMTADPPRKDGGALFLSKRFLDTCSFYYSVCPSTPEIKEQFGSKHFNVIDFLRMNNNLGRSVSRGNFFRIRSAFTLGAKRLAGILDCPQENVVTELNRFFANTWEMNGRVVRPDTHFVHSSGFVNWCQMEKGEEVDDPGFLYDASSFTIHSPENRLFCSEYIERKQSPLDDRFWNAFTMDLKSVADHTQCQSHTNVFQHFCHEVDGGKEDDRFWSTGTTNLSFQTPDWVPATSTPLHACSWRTAVHNPSTHPNLTYTCQGKGKRKIKFVVCPSGSTIGTADSVHWQDNSSKSKECTHDILGGNLASHLRNMLYAQSCQNSKLEGPYLCRPSIVQAQYLEGQFLSGDPGRPAKNYTDLPETAVMPSSYHHSNESSLAGGGYKHCPKGTHLLNLKTEKSCRDFECSSSRNQKGNYRYHRKEQYKARQWEKRYERSGARNERVHMEWIALGEQPSFAQAKRY